MDKDEKTYVVEIVENRKTKKVVGKIEIPVEEKVKSYGSESTNKKKTM